MHKIHEKEFTLEDFSTDKIIDTGEPGYENMYNDLTLTLHYDGEKQYYDPHDIFSEILIPALNLYRKRYLETKDKKYWWQMIQLLPSSYNQKRTVKLNYEVLANMYEFRHNHKLDEWVELMKFFKENCPYSEIFTTDFKKQEREEIRKTEIKNFHDFICENLFNNIDVMIANDDLEKIQYTMLQLIISNKIDSLTDEYLNKEKKGVKE